MFFEKERQTGLLCAFLRAHHLRTDGFHVFDDPMCRALPRELYDQVYASIAKGQSFFGNEKGSTDAVINAHLSGEVVARTAFHQNRLCTAVQLGARRWCNWAPGWILPATVNAVCSAQCVSLMWTVPRCWRKRLRCWPKCQRRTQGCRWREI